MTQRAHGIGLLSGGLDSALAAKVVAEAGARVTCLHFFTGFCVTGHNNRIGRKNRPIGNPALRVADELGIPVELIDISEEYLSVVTDPKHGYGANMNPCIDCRILMLSKGKKYMEEVGADFVFTGEVLGQRPMSQHRQTLTLTAQDSGLEGKLLRPLSAKLQDPTEVEKSGLIDREKLYGFHGRSRKPQLELAKSFGIAGFAQPSGGCCFLTDESYSRKLKDLLRSSSSGDLSMDDVYLLGVGRHFRLSPTLKVIVGRDEIENNFLEFYVKNYWSARASDYPGPTTLIIGDATEEQFEAVGSVVARYCDGRDQPEVSVEFRRNGALRTVEVVPASDELIEEIRI